MRQLFQVDFLRDFEIIEKIGSGKYAKVAISHKFNGPRVAAAILASACHNYFWCRAPSAKQQDSFAEHSKASQYGDRAARGQSVLSPAFYPPEALAGGAYFVGSFFSFFHLFISLNFKKKVIKSTTPHPLT